MTDIFFSYRSTDRDRVRVVRDAFAERGFEVFWDQQVPAGADWDSWIRQHLTKSKCAIVFWSAASVESDNVRHEATIAKLQGKLIAVLLEILTPDQFPMGQYSQQAIDLSKWKGDFEDENWRKLDRDVETKLMPPWVQRKILEFETALAAERLKREGLETRDKILQAQIATEVLQQNNLRRERNESADQIAALKTTVDGLQRERDKAIEDRAALKTTTDALRHKRDQAVAATARLKPNRATLHLPGDGSKTTLPFEAGARESPLSESDTELEAQIWMRVEANRNLAEIEQFLSAHAKSPFAQKAKALAEELWRATASSRNTLRLEQFIQQNPQSIFLQDAKILLSWHRMRDSNDLDEVETFLTTFPRFQTMLQLKRLNPFDFSQLPRRRAGAIESVTQIDQIDAEAVTDTVSRIFYRSLYQPDGRSGHGPFSLADGKVDVAERYLAKHQNGILRKKVEAALEWFTTVNSRDIVELEKFFVKYPQDSTIEYKLKDAFDDVRRRISSSETRKRLIGVAAAHLTVLLLAEWYVWQHFVSDSSWWSLLLKIAAMLAIPAGLWISFAMTAAFVRDRNYF